MTSRSGSSRKVGLNCSRVIARKVLVTVTSELSASDIALALLWQWCARLPVVIAEQHSGARAQAQARVEGLPLGVAGEIDHVEVPQPRQQPLHQHCANPPALVVRQH